MSAPRAWSAHQYSLIEAMLRLPGDRLQIRSPLKKQRRHKKISLVVKIPTWYAFCSDTVGGKSGLHSSSTQQTHDPLTFGVSRMATIQTRLSRQLYRSRDSFVIHMATGEQLA